MGCSANNFLCYTKETEASLNVPVVNWGDENIAVSDLLIKWIVLDKLLLVRRELAAVYQQRVMWQSRDVHTRMHAKCVCVCVLQIHDLLNKGIDFGFWLDIPLAERLSLFSFLPIFIFSLSHTRTHLHTHIYIYIFAAKNARQCEQKKNTPLNGEHCPSFGLVCELYAQYQVAILYLCIEKYLF